MLSESGHLLFVENDAKAQNIQPYTQADQGIRIPQCPYDLLSNGET